MSALTEPLPKQILDLERGDGELEVTWIPWVPGVRWLLFGALLALEGILGWNIYVSTIGGPDLTWILGPVALVVLYLMPMVALNRMRLRLRGERLEVGFLPVPNPLGCCLDVGDITDLEVEIRHRSSSGRRSTSYAVLLAELAGGTRRKLMTGYPETAEFLEAELRGALGLEAREPNP